MLCHILTLVLIMKYDHRHEGVRRLHLHCILLPNSNWNNISDRCHDEKLTPLTYNFVHKCTLCKYIGFSFNANQTCYSVCYFSYFYSVLQKNCTYEFQILFNKKMHSNRMNWKPDSNSITYQWNIYMTSAFGSD